MVTISFSISGSNVVDSFIMLRWKNEMLFLKFIEKSMQSGIR
jgi:hypothetical protein